MRMSLRTGWPIFLITAFCFFSAVAVRCASVEDYKSRLGRARTEVESLLSDLRDDTFDEPKTQDAVRRIRRLVPESEKIEFDATAIETSNGWLSAELSSLEKETGGAGRKQILTGILDRLASIESRVIEIEAASAASGTKDADKQKLNEILSRAEYQKPAEQGESLFQRFVNWLLDLLRRLFPRPEMGSVNPQGFQALSVVIQVLVYGVIIGLIVYLVYKFAPALAARFSRSRKGAQTSRVVLGERIDESVSSSDLFSEAEQLARQGDIRSAIRKGYIALICDLADRNIIRLARHKTNRDYLADVAKRTSLLTHIRPATGSFERFWYGSHAPLVSDWEEFKNRYHSAIREI